jgi:phosphate-selective porin OprO/OprP
MSFSQVAAVGAKAAGVLVGLAMVAGSVRAEEWRHEMTEMRDRLERLEEQCQTLHHQNANLRLQIEEDRQRLAFEESREHDGDVAFSGHRFLAEEKPSPESERKEDEITWYEVGKQLEFKAVWRNGLVMETVDKAFRVHVGGRMHMDGGWWISDEDLQFGPEGVGALEDGANYRRARIRVNGLIYDTVEWVMEYGFENGLPQFFDVYGELPNLPIGALRLGHFREPFSMDSLTSGNYLPFMERSLFHDALVPFRNTGVMLYDNALDEQVLWAMGMFRTQSDNNGASAGDGDYSWTGRLTWNPWYEAEGQYALHFGGAASYRALPSLPPPGVPLPVPDRRFRFATRPEFRVNAPFFADTGRIHSEDMSLVGAEAGLGLGPLLLQSEYVAAHVYDAAILPVVGADSTDLFFHGFYAQASWFLTGEHRPYVRRQGVFGQMKPHENFFWVEDEVCGGTLFGRGAWEAAIRYSHLDLTDQGIEGGVLSDVTFGLNWYLNPNSRFMSNVILIDRNAPGDASDGQATAIGARFQIDF